MMNGIGIVRIERKKKLFSSKDPTLLWILEAYRIFLFRLFAFYSLSNSFHLSFSLFFSFSSLSNFDSIQAENQHRSMIKRIVGNRINRQPTNMFHIERNHCIWLRNVTLENDVEFKRLILLL